MATPEERLVRYELALQKIARSREGAERPEWFGAHDSGNFDDVEQNGYQIATHDFADIADEALAE